MKVNLLCKTNTLLRDFDVLPDDDENDIVLPDTAVSLSDWGQVRTGMFNFPLHRSLELSTQYWIEFENGEKKEIVFTRLQATGHHLRVGFKIKDVR
jgi:hypothetical protein